MKLGKKRGFPRSLQICEKKPKCCLFSCPIHLPQGVKKRISIYQRYSVSKTEVLQEPVSVGCCSLKYVFFFFTYKATNKSSCEWAHSQYEQFHLSVKDFPNPINPIVTYTWQLKCNTKCYLIHHHKHYACVNSPHTHTPTHTRTHTYLHQYIPQKCPFVFFYVFFYIYPSLSLSVPFRRPKIRYIVYCKYTSHILTTKFTINRRTCCILIVNLKRHTSVSGEWNREMALKREGGEKELAWKQGSGGGGGLLLRIVVGRVFGAVEVGQLLEARAPALEVVIVQVWIRGHCFQGT